MGTINKGILGGFSGTVGTIVGANWRGMDIIRSRPKRTKSQPTDKQLLQQMKFATVNRFLQPLRAIQSVLFGNISGTKSRRNLATAYHLREALTLNAGMPELVYTKVQITKGELAGFQNVTAVPQPNGKIAFTWEDNSLQAGAALTDVFCAVCYCPELNEFSLHDTAQQRATLGAEAVLPAFMQGKDVQVYAYFRNSESSSACNSVYLGEYTVL